MISCFFQLRFIAFASSRALFRRSLAETIILTSDDTCVIAAARHLVHRGWSLDWSKGNR